MFYTSSHLTEGCLLPYQQPSIREVPIDAQVNGQVSMRTQKNVTKNLPDDIFLRFQTNMGKKLLKLLFYIADNTVSEWIHFYIYL